jgi:hypothetical protein
MDFNGDFNFHGMPYMSIHTDKNNKNGSNPEGIHRQKWTVGISRRVTTRKQ